MGMGAKCQLCHPFTQLQVIDPEVTVKKYRVTFLDREAFDPVQRKEEV